VVDRNAVGDRTCRAGDIAGTAARRPRRALRSGSTLRALNTLRPLGPGSAGRAGSTSCAGRALDVGLGIPAHTAVPLNALQLPALQRQTSPVLSSRYMSPSIR